MYILSEGPKRLLYDYPNATRWMKFPCTWVVRLMTAERVIKFQRILGLFNKILLIHEVYRISSK